MKRFAVLFMVFALLLATYAPTIAEKNLGYKTDIFLAMYEGVMSPMGLPYWPLDMTEEEKSAKTVLKLITDDISIKVTQSDGMVTEFQITTHADENETEDHKNNMIFCMYGAMMVADMEMPVEDLLGNLTEVLTNGEATFNGITYRFVSTAPFSDAIAFVVTPAEELTK